jgi:hypothetical protein
MRTAKRPVLVSVLYNGRFHQVPEAEIVAAGIVLNDYGTANFVLPEVSHSVDAGRTHATEFPSVCPCCCAKRLSLNACATTPTYRREAAYDCGARYAHKPQIQNHTEKWWGMCPRQRDKIASVMAARGVPAE